MASVFGDHVPGIPYRPIADLFALYRDRDPAKTAIVDLHSGLAITFGELDQVTTDIAALLKRRGVVKGSRVLLLSDENLEKLLLWFGIWRLGAVVCPLNVEINAKVLGDLIPVVNPALVLWHKDLDIEALAGGCLAPRMRFAEYTPNRRMNCFLACRGTIRLTCLRAMTRETSRASSARREPRVGPRSWSMTIAPIGSTACPPSNSSAFPRTIARWNTAPSAGTPHRC